MPEDNVVVIPVVDLNVEEETNNFKEVIQVVVILIKMLLY